MRSTTPVSSTAPSRLLLAVALAASVLAAACTLEPGTTRERTAIELGLTGSGDAATLRLTGEPAYDGAAEVSCGPAADGEGTAFSVRLAPATDPGTEVAVVVPRFAGSGDYQGELTVRRVGADGAVVESTGEAEVHLSRATDAAGAHAAAGTVRGAFAGAAGGGEVSADLARCYYFG